MLLLIPNMRRSVYCKYFSKIFKHYLPANSILRCSKVDKIASRPFSQLTSESTRMNVASNSKSTFVPFEKMLKMRRLEAKRSILVQVHSEQSCKQLYDYCQSFGSVKKLLHYTISDQHFAIVEFNQEDSVLNVVNLSGHIDESQIVPVRSPFLWFRNNFKNVKLKKGNEKSESMDIDFTKFGAISLPNFEDISSLLLTVDSISDQMLILQKALSLDDLGVRMRFLTALQIESIISGIFPLGKVLPFGSTVNGFGKIGCDLDIVVRLDSLFPPPENSRLIFQTKTSLLNGRTQQQRYIESIGDFIERYLPGCTDVKKILLARVPILKYKQEYTGVECDLSLTNMTGVYMAEILYIYSCLDHRVRPFVYTVRYWAQVINLTNPIPGRWITNFSVTLLALFYLQHIKILPTLDNLVKLSRHEDRRFAEDVNCTFLRDISPLLEKGDSSNKSSLSDLLKGFFEYYSLFDFDSHAISLRQGKPLPKQEYSALYIVNPLESHLNVSKNVSPEEMGRIKIEMCNAARYLDREESKPKEEDWGLVTLFNSSHYASRKDVFSAIHKKQFATQRLVTVTDLFSEDDEVEEKKFIRGDVQNKPSKNKKYGQR